MTDIMNSPAVKQVMKQPGHVSADGAAQAQGEQPIRAAVVRAAELARDAESNARTRQHAKGKMTARERLGLLLDTGSFEEIGRFRGGDINGGKAGSAVITGFGDVYGRKIAVYAQDFSVRGGTLGRAEGEKICHLMDMALDLKVPIVAIVDSGGARIQEGVAALTQYGHIFRKTCDASGFVPQISLILGPCAGGAVYCPALTDLIVMTKENSDMFVTGPDVVKAATGETISMNDLGGGLVHSTKSGVAHYLGEDEADAIDYARTVLAYLPSNSDAQPPMYAYAATRADRETAKRLTDIVPDNDRQPYDVLDVIRCIVDYGEFVQVHELFATSAVVGFACIDGRPIGVVANQPNVRAGILDVDASEKVARFVRLCDSFNLPVITLVDTPGYKPGADQEHAGIIRRGAKVIYVRRRVHRDGIQGDRRGHELRVAQLADRGARRHRRGEHHPPQGLRQGQGGRRGRRRAAGQARRRIRAHHRQREPVARNGRDRRDDRSRADPSGHRRIAATARRQEARAPHHQASRQPAAVVHPAAAATPRHNRF